MSYAFEFRINIGGLVVWQPADDQRTGSLLAVRTGSGGAHGGGQAAGWRSQHPHTAAFAYLLSGLSGLDNRPVKAPDPLVASPAGSAFARRVLEDEILWVEPVWADEEEHLLEVEAPHLLSLSELDSRVTGIDPSCFLFDLAGSPAVARLDVSAGRLHEIEDEYLPGPWQIRADDAGGSAGPTIDTIADGLRLTFNPVSCVTIHSNKRPALRFASESPVVASYTAEPAVDYEPSLENLLPHFDMAYNVVTWDGERPAHPRRPFLTEEAAAWHTIRDRACPPIKG